MKKLIKNTIFIMLLSQLFYSCKTGNDKVKKPIEEFSRSYMGYEYTTIKNDFFSEVDSILNIYPGSLGGSENIDIHILPVLCFNKKRDKFKTILIQHKSKVSSIGYICGFKYKGQWEFFRPSLGVLYFNKHLGYPDNVAIPLPEMEEYARGYLNGYLKKNKKTGEWEINEKFFTSIFEGSGWSNSEGDELLEKYMNKVRWRNEEMAIKKAELRAKNSIEKSEKSILEENNPK